LLERAFEQLYRDVAGGRPPEGLVPKEELLRVLIANVTGGAQPILRAFEDIIRHISHSTDHFALRGAIRSYRDPAATWVLEALLKDAAQASPSVASAFSSICRGLDHYSVAFTNTRQPASQHDGWPEQAVMAEQVLRRFLRL